MRLRGLIVITVLMLPGLLGAQSANQLAVDAWLDQLNKRWDASIVKYTKAIRLTPKDADLFFGRGMSYEGKGNYGLAIQDFNQAILLKPSLDGAIFERGQCYRALGQYEGALKDYTEVIRLNPDDALAFYGRGVIWEVRGDLEKALEEYNGAIRAFSDYPDAYGARGRVYEKKDDHESAVRDLDLAIAGHPQVADWFRYRGLARGNKGEWDLAIDDFGKALSLDLDADTFLASGGVYDGIHNNGDLTLLYRAQILIARGEAYRHKGDKLHAIEDLEQAAKYDPQRKDRIELEIKEVQRSK